MRRADEGRGRRARRVADLDEHAMARADGDRRRGLNDAGAHMGHVAHVLALERRGQASSRVA